MKLEERKKVVEEMEEIIFPDLDSLLNVVCACSRITSNKGILDGDRITAQNLASAAYHAVSNHYATISDETLGKFEILREIKDALDDFGVIWNGLLKAPSLKERMVYLSNIDNLAKRIADLNLQYTFQIKELIVQDSSTY